MANKFSLSGDGIQIDYTIGANPSFVALTFTEGTVVKTFKPAQITTDQTALGAIVSVTLMQSIDNGGTRFGFLLPAVQVASGKQVAVMTIGIMETFAGPDTVPHVGTTLQCVHLHGTAEEVVVPLLATAPA